MPLPANSLSGDVPLFLPKFSLPSQSIFFRPHQQLDPEAMSVLMYTISPVILTLVTHLVCSHAAELEEAGADHVVIRSVEAGLAMGSSLLGALGASELDLNFLKRGIEATIEAR